ncbi:MAG: hypothetical protein GF408_02275 [Candidatus Omnitrophica bacterium]|nr:hypothetical protein [Candidatus Omnitrophota bacterium]
MKKLIAAFTASLILAITLFLAALFYIDLSGHKHFVYKAVHSGIETGDVVVDRYVTEDKLIYKSLSDLPLSLGENRSIQRLYLDKHSLRTLKYTEKSGCGKHASSVTLLFREGETVDYLYMRYPAYFNVKGFSTGENTLVFSPEDIMLYMPLVDKYNFWKKGVQHFEVQVPVDAPVPLMRDKLEMKYRNDEYFTALGRRVEAESYTIGSSGLPEAELLLSKHSHQILSLKVPQRKTAFRLQVFTENPGDRVKLLFGTVSARLRSLLKKKLSAPDREPREEEYLFDAPEEMLSRKGIRSEKIYYGPPPETTQGTLYYPEKGTPSASAILVSGYGAYTQGDLLFLESLADGLAGQGIATLVTGNRTRGGNPSAGYPSDAAVSRDIKKAGEFLLTDERTAGLPLSVIGYNEAGRYALNAALSDPDMASCVLIGLPFTRNGFSRYKEVSYESLQSFLRQKGLGNFDTDYLKMAAGLLKRHLTGLYEGKPAEDIFFRNGIRLPAEDFRNYLSGMSSDTLKSVDKPVLLIFARNDKVLTPELLEKIGNAKKNSPDSFQTAVFRELPPYYGAVTYTGEGIFFKPEDDVLDIVTDFITSAKKKHDRSGVPESAGGKQIE